MASLDFSRCFRPLIWVTTLFKSSVCWMGLNDVGQRHTLLLLHSVCEMHSNASLHERHMEGANATCLAEVLPKAVRGAKVWHFDACRLQNEIIPISKILERNGKQLESGRHCIMRFFHILQLLEYVWLTSHNFAIQQTFSGVNTTAGPSASKLALKANLESTDSLETALRVKHRKIPKRL